MIELGASEAPAALGVDPRTTPYMLWLRKLGLLPPVESDEIMRNGSLLEPVILRAFINDVLERQDYAASPFTERRSNGFRATPDGVVPMGGDAFALVEVKCVIGHPPTAPRAEWVIQCLAQRLPYPEPERHYLVAFGNLHREWWQLPKHDRALDRVRREMEAFLRLVDTQEPPPVRAEDASVIAKTWPLVKPYIKTLPPEFATFDREYIQGAAIEAQGKEQKDLARARIALEIGDAEEAVLIEEGRLAAKWVYRTNKNGVRPLRRAGGGDES